MKHLISCVLLCLISVEAFAQSTVSIRNDSASQTLAGTNLTSSLLSTTSKGELYIAGAGTASSLGKAEDTVHTSGDTGVLGLSVRQDSITSLSGADGEYDAQKNDADGRLYVNSFGTSPDKFLQACSGTIVNTTDTAIVGAAGAGVRIYVTSYVCTNDSATKSLLNLKDGSTTKWTDIVNVNTTSGNRVSHVFPQPIRGTANTAFNVGLVTTATSTVCCVTYYTSSN